VQIIGNLGADPQIRNTQSGMAIASFRVAATEKWKDSQTGEQKERTEWVSVVVMNEYLSKLAEDRLRKGSQVFVEGQMQTRKWTDNNGIERYMTEVVVGKMNSKLVIINDRQGGDTQSHEPASTSRSTRSRSSAPSAPSTGWDDSDEVPF
jgi:single-strand DNA-binding protein